MLDHINKPINSFIRSQFSFSVILHWITLLHSLCCVVFFLFLLLSFELFFSFNQWTPMLTNLLIFLFESYFFPKFCHTSSKVKWFVIRLCLSYLWSVADVCVHMQWKNKWQQKYFDWGYKNNVHTTCYRYVNEITVDFDRTELNQHYPLLIQLKMNQIGINNAIYCKILLSLVFLYEKKIF